MTIDLNTLSSVITACATNSVEVKKFDAQNHDISSIALVDDMVGDEMETRNLLEIVSTMEIGDFRPIFVKAISIIRGFSSFEPLESFA